MVKVTANDVFSNPKGWMGNRRSNVSEAVAEKRRGFCNTKVTLNGKPATISGALFRFAIVSDNATGLSCEFSWEAVESVINKGGNFRS